IFLASPPPTPPPRSGKEMERKFLVLLRRFSCESFEVLVLLRYKECILYIIFLISKYTISVMSIANNLQKLRAEKKYSLERVARLADLSLSTVVKIEDGTNQNPTIDTLSKIAKVFEVKVDDLMQK
ncbi:MAG: hypothetical protein COW50_00970, partial [Candidatus Moranbacteria bacterium CG17_big_fil_post_rev_8_21_14_2_50_41_107]